MDTSPSDALRVDGLRKTFDATDDEQVPVRALRGVDLASPTASSSRSWGPSGCGKSTLLNLVAGLDTPTTARSRSPASRSTGRTEDELAVMRRRHIGIVFQFFNLLEGMSVLENVTLPAVIAGAPRKQAEIRARRDLLDLLGLADKARKTRRACCPAGSASGSRSPGRSPTSRRCCSPTSRPARSTPRAAHEVLELFRRLHAGGQTILMVTHDDEVAAAADRIVRMRDGRIDDGATPAVGPVGGVFGVLEDPAS